MCYASCAPMPPQSNVFQKLVAFVAEQLSPGARVTESAQVPDVDGVLREIDTLVEVDLPVGTLSLAFESRDRSRRSDIQWIEELIGKRNSLPTIGHFIAVSRKGFTSTAIAKAQRNGIRLMSLQKANEIDWSTFRDLRAVEVTQHFKLVGVTPETRPPLNKIEWSAKVSSNS